MKTRGRIHLTFLASSLGIGGAEHMLLELIRHMDRETYEVSIICLRSGSDMFPEFERLGVRTVENLMSGRFDLSIVWKLPSLLRNLETDVLCTLNHDDAMFWGKISSRIAHVPAVMIWVHSTFIPGKKLIVRAVNRFTMNMADRVIAISEMHRRKIFSTYAGIREDKLAVIYNGIDISVYGAERSGAGRSEFPEFSGFRHIVGTIARLSPEKSIDVLLRAARLVVDMENETLFVIVGDGTEREGCEALAEKLVIQDNVKFLGMRRDIPAILRNFDFAVLSSREEVFPMFLLEAMTAQLPVVSTRVGSIEEIVVDGETGFLVESGDHEALADRILTLIRDTERARTMGENGRRRVENLFSIEKMVSDTQGLIEELLGKNSH